MRQYKPTKIENNWYVGFGKRYFEEPVFKTKEEAEYWAAAKTAHDAQMIINQCLLTCAELARLGHAPPGAVGHGYEEPEEAEEAVFEGFDLYLQ